MGELMAAYIARLLIVAGCIGVLIGVGLSLLLG